MKKVTIYALSTCLWCRKTKKYFEEKKIPFDSVDYDKQDEEKQKAMTAEMKAAGFNCSFPFVRIDGECTQGFDPAEFDRMLDGK